MATDGAKAAEDHDVPKFLVNKWLNIGKAYFKYFKLLTPYLQIVAISPNSLKRRTKVIVSSSMAVNI